jgi:hypothetical protein
VQTIRYILIAALVAAASAVEAGPFGADYGFDEVRGPVYRAGEALPKANPAWLAEVFEHVINPEAPHQPSNRKE